LAEPGWIFRKLGNGLCQLGAGAIQISMMEVMQSNGSLDETLVEKAQRTPGRPPEILPALVGLKVSAGIEKIYSGNQEIGHRKGLAKLLRGIAQIAKIDNG
jgi:hypothetical protein